MNSSKKRCIFFLVSALLMLIFCGSLTALIDPLFHYHKPLEMLQYPIHNQRYQNDGIVRHFDYDAIITGTSMTENFKASEFDALFSVSSVKVNYSGATLRETNDTLLRAVDSNPNIRIILRGLDGWSLFDGKDHMRTDAEYPTYLYDDSVLNDIQYLFNKDIFFKYTLEALKHTLKGLPTTDFDTYSSWDTSATGRDVILAHYQRPENPGNQNPDLSEEEILNLKDTLEQNVIAIARENPDIQFYYFFTPYSIYYMDYLNQMDLLLRYFQAYQLATEMLLAYDNIHLYSFFSDYETITNPDVYTDITHYNADINSLLLRRMANGEYLLTRDNTESHWQSVTDYYMSYDYASLFP